MTQNFMRVLTCILPVSMWQWISYVISASLVFLLWTKWVEFSSAGKGGQAQATMPSGQGGWGPRADETAVQGASRSPRQDVATKTWQRCWGAVLSALGGCEGTALGPLGRPWVSVEGRWAPEAEWSVVSGQPGVSRPQPLTSTDRPRRSRLWLPSGVWVSLEGSVVLETEAWPGWPGSLGTAHGAHVLAP